MINTMILHEDFDLPNVWVAFGAAVSLHWVLFMWNPTVLSGGNVHQQPFLMQVQFRDALPQIPKIVEAPKPVPPKPIQKKAKKAGVHMARSSPRLVVVPKIHKIIVVPKPHPKIDIPKFIPHEADDVPLAGAHPPQLSAVPVKRPEVLAAAPHLLPRNKGIAPSRVPFKLEDAGSLVGTVRATMPVVKIAVAADVSETATASAPLLHDAPNAQARAIPSYHPVETGELAGRSKVGYHGSIVPDAVPDEALAASRAVTNTISGQGFDLGGPIGDRKILNKTLPTYPPWAEEKGITALVKIYFTVDADGHVRAGMKILNSSGYVAMDQLAKDALKGWTFSPTDAEGEPAWGVITFRFTLS